jgi:phage N-6-adenine-methyltransferase
MSELNVAAIFGRTETTKDEWITPPNLIKSVGGDIGFDLDPCSPINRPFETARNYFTIEDDGLKQEWEGRVWMNPPYGGECKHWLKKLADHGNGIALVFARTETQYFFDSVWNKADAILFVKRRINFLNVDGTKGKNGSNAPSVFIAYGKENAEILKNCGIEGRYIDLK